MAQAGLKNMPGGLAAGPAGGGRLNNELASGLN
jgi:hypothetical protein